MRKIIVMLIASTAAISAMADLTSWSWEGGIISPDLAAGTYIGGALTLSYDPSLDPSYTGTGIDYIDMGRVIGVHDLFVAPDFAGGTYSTSVVTSDSSVVGPVWLVIDPNGGGAQPGDFYGFGGSGTLIDLQPSPANPSGDPQTFSGGDVYVMVEDVPEPSTIVLMGIAGSLVVSARKMRFR